MLALPGAASGPAEPGEVEDALFEEREKGVTGKKTQFVGTGCETVRVLREVMCAQRALEEACGSRQLREELVTLAKLHYRNRNQHRRSKQFQKVRGARKACERLVRAAPELCLAPLASSLGSQAGSALLSTETKVRDVARKVELPVSEIVRSGLRQLTMCSDLAARAARAAEDAVSCCEQMLGSSYFMALTLVWVASMSRVRVFCLHVGELLRQLEAGMGELLESCVAEWKTKTTTVAKRLDAPTPKTPVFVRASSVEGNAETSPGVVQDIFESLLSSAEDVVVPLANKKRPRCAQSSGPLVPSSKRKKHVP